MVDGFRKQIRPQLKTDTGGDNRLSGIGNAKLSVTGRVKGLGRVTGTVTASPRKLAGPWRWLEDGTRPHYTHNGTRRHPGTAGKRTWTKPVDKAYRSLESDVLRMWDNTLR